MQLMSLCALSSVLTVLLMVLLAPLSAHANRDHVKTPLEVSLERYFEPGTLPHDRVYELVHWARRAHAAAFVEQRRVHETDSLVSECSRMIGVKTPDIVRHLEPHVYELLEAFVLNGNSPRMYLFDMLYSLKHKDAHHRREDVVTETEMLVGKRTTLDCEKTNSSLWKETKEAEIKQLLEDVNRETSAYEKEGKEFKAYHVIREAFASIALQSTPNSHSSTVSSDKDGRRTRAQAHVQSNAQHIPDSETGSSEFMASNTANTNQLVTSPTIKTSTHTRRGSALVSGALLLLPILAGAAVLRIRKPVVPSPTASPSFSYRPGAVVGALSVPVILTAIAQRRTNRVDQEHPVRVDPPARAGATAGLFDSIPAWVWLLVAGGAILAVVAVILLVRAYTRHAVHSFQKRQAAVITEDLFA
ncbi:unnamed protein product (mitochondrion) [Plasmodiophora brassicae]|uniref:Uncharacterized protein n=1 Tax=Plasmodiophora brassicae TaxID=37360 RepID=A0A3P3YNV7_PLABS|nr:unnamed protein product [Plasmodiophora brassicae]